MKKRRLALLIAVILVFSLTMTACALLSPETSTLPEGEESGEPLIETAYKVGINIWGADVPAQDRFGVEAKYAMELLGSSTQIVSYDFTDDDELTDIQDSWTAEVDGVLMQGAATTMSHMVQVCTDAKIPFCLFTFIGDDRALTNLAKNNPYYAGAVDSDMVYDGKVMAQEAIKAGCKKAVLIGGDAGDNNMDQRSRGFRDEFKARGGTILDEARCADVSECEQDAADMLSANMGADCLYAMSGDYIPGSLSAIDALGLAGNIKVFVSCVDRASAELIKKGRIVMGNDGTVLAASIVPTLLLNRLDGHPIKDSNGEPPRLRTIPFIVNATNADAYMAMFCADNVHPFTAQMLQNLCWRYNPDVTYQTYVDFINNLDLNAVLQYHSLPVVG